jgi:hypothetical protein
MQLRNTLEAMVSMMTNIATTNGFTLEGHGELIQGKRIVTWLKDLGWKRDVIQLAIREKSPVEFVVSFDVRLMLEDGRKILLDGQGVAWLARKEPGYKITKISGEMAWEDAVKRSLLDVREQIEWFEQLYGTPQKCLTRISQQFDRNGCRAGFPPAVDHLLKEIGIASSANT